MGEVMSVSLSADGRRALAGNSDGTIRFLQFNFGLEPRVLRPDAPQSQSLIKGIVLREDGNVALVWGHRLNVPGQCFLKLWDLRQGKELKSDAPVVCDAAEEFASRTVLFPPLIEAWMLHEIS